MRRLSYLILIALLAYAALPYWAAYSLGQAVDAADAEALEDKVDWVSVRAGLQEDLSNHTQAELQGASNQGSVLAQLATALAPSVVGEALDYAVTPERIAAMLKSTRGDDSSVSSGNSTTENTEEEGGVTWAFFNGMNEFRVAYAPKADSNEIDLIFTRQGLSWPLTRIHLPDNLLSELAL